MHTKNAKHLQHERKWISLTMTKPATNMAEIDECAPRLCTKFHILLNETNEVGYVLFNFVYFNLAKNFELRILCNMQMEYYII